MLVGSELGCVDGSKLGCIDGPSLGPTLGDIDGKLVGFLVGPLVEMVEELTIVGVVFVPEIVGIKDGESDGIQLGMMEILLSFFRMVGLDDGAVDGLSDGIVLGSELGLEDCKSLGGASVLTL
jgi:hypothetical protein